MHRRIKRQQKPEEQHTHLAIRVEHYEARVAASINNNARAPQYAWNLNDADPVYEFTNQVMITGISTFPPERAGDTYDLAIHGNDAPSRHLDAKLKDIQARDQHGSPQYGEYRGRQIPVYVAPNGFGLLDKIRGEARWTAWLFVAQRFVNDALILLSYRTNLFVDLHERKVERSRWVQGLSLQTIDPAEE